MALPTSGQISLTQIANEFECEPNLLACAAAAGLSSKNISFSSFYGLSSVFEMSVRPYPIEKDVDMGSAGELPVNYYIAQPSGLGALSPSSWGGIGILGTVGSSFTYYGYVTTNFILALSGHGGAASNPNMAIRMTSNTGKSKVLPYDGYGDPDGEGNIGSGYLFGNTVQQNIQDAFFEEYVAAGTGQKTVKYTLEWTTV